jgi:hypothetical protein
MIKSGRYGQVSYDPTGGASLVPLVSINDWKGSFKPDYEEVSCFGDTNKVWLPGLMNIDGTFSGFWNSADLTLWAAAMSPTPGMLQLMPNLTEAAFFWQGLAYMAADIDCTLKAPKVTGTFKAAGSWQVPGAVVATGAGPGTGPGSWTPANAMPAASLAGLAGVTATPATAWTTGQYVLLRDGTKAHWTGTAWAAGAA